MRLGTLSNHGNDSSFKKHRQKKTLRSFKLNHIYLDLLNMLNAATFPGVEFLRILLQFKKRKEN